MSDKGYVEVVYTRGEVDESIHYVHGAVVDRAGAVIASYGDVEQPVFPRSSFKPFQSLAMIASGAADALELEVQHLALSMASHSGETRHTQLVLEWLGRLGLAEDALRCGQHQPMLQKAFLDLVREGTPLSPKHHNCSGKHTGMLSLNAHLAATKEGNGDADPDYEAYDHAVQKEIRRVASLWLELDLNEMPHGIDGCSVPNYAIPLMTLAHGYALMSDPEALSGDRAAFAEPVKRLTAAWAERPDLVAGAERFDTALMLASDSKVLSKGGAEGVQAALVPETGLGFAVKAGDGAQRAAEQAILALIRQFGGVEIDDETLEKNWLPATGKILNARALEVGQVRVTFDAH